MFIGMRNRRLATLIIVCMTTAVSLETTVSTAVADDKTDSSGEKLNFPLGKQLQVLERDLTNTAYHDVLETMIYTDLAAEWLRVGTPDNYRTFLKQHGGKEKVLATPGLKKAYERRLKIADDFLALIRKAHTKIKRKLPYNEQTVKELLDKAVEKEQNDASVESVSVRVADSVVGAEKNWHRMRGPSGQGTVIETTFPLNWSADENITWKTSIPGAGNSSPVVWGEKIFITSASDDGSQRWLLCYSRTDGRELWKREVPKGKAEKAEKLYWKNSYASSTAVTDGKYVIAFFGNSGMVCYNFEGEMLWHVDLGAFTTMHGPGTTPVLHNDIVYFVQDQNNNESVFVALDKRTGEIRWKQPRPKHACWSSPVVLRVGEQDQLVYNGSYFVSGYNLETGEEIWKFEGTTRESVPMIVAGGGMLFSTSGRNGPTYAIKPGGTGDVTKSHQIWKKQRGGAHVPTPLYFQDILYVVSDTGILTALDAKTGETIWLKRLRGRFSMSPLEAAGKIIMTNESGKTFILKAGTKYDLLAENDLDEGVLATPAILGGQIFFRTDANLICVGKRITQVVD